ncbi:MAG: 30S ribosomal protein S20 [Planctomycetia bacterium]|nr:30S ribosomal protein S20 [Planctomycetia bacterium]
MPHSVSAKKRLRQNLRNRDRNRAAKSDLRTSIKRVIDALGEGDAALARERFRVVAKKADRAAAARTIHPNRAARIKSRLSARMLAASKGEAKASGGAKTAGTSK